MKPILYSRDTTSFLTNGFGRMSDAISCKVVEERNGEYELTMTYPVSGRHFSEIAERMILYAIHDEVGDRQPFRIYEISKPLNGVVTIRARHVSYDLKNIVVSPFTAGSISAAFTGLTDNSSSDNPFDFSTFGLQVTGDFVVEVPSNCRALLGGTQGSILDVFGVGEYEWDHWHVNLRANRGHEKNVTISYGKNLTELEDTLNVANTYNAVYPYWRGHYKQVDYTEDDSGTSTTVDRFVYLSDDPTKRILRANIEDENGNPVDLPLEVVPLDLSSVFTDTDEPPSPADLLEQAEKFLKNNEPWAENRNITVSFVPLWQTEEYKNLTLEKVSLCDTVNVVHKRLGVTVKKKVTKVEYDVLNERYISMTLGGNTSQSFSSAIAADFSEVKSTIVPKSDMEIAINHATEMIRGGLGGHVIINTDANGKPIELVIADNEDLNKATRVWRWNQNGLGFSAEGYDGGGEGGSGYALAMTSDGAIVADRITVGKLTADIIKVGVLTAGNGVTTIDMLTGLIQASNAIMTGSFMTKSGSSESKLTSGYLAFYNDSNIVGMLRGDATAYQYQEYNSNPVFNIIAGADSKGIVFSDHTNVGGGESGTYHFAYNCGLNPNGYTQRFYFGDTAIFTRLVTMDGGITMNGTYYNPLTLKQTFSSWDRSVSVSCGNITDVGASFRIDGNLWVTGNVYGGRVKDRAVSTEHYGTVGLNAMESTTAVFSDLGSGTVDDTGKTYCFFAPDFQETIDLSHDYQVFLTKTSTGELDRAEKFEDHFVVYGSPGTTFDWIVYAKQRDYANHRLERINVDETDPNEAAGLYFDSEIES